MGVSHMLEHMAFKGTERRSARDIAEEIEAVGGFLNAYTSREQTAFHARVLKADVPLAIDILADILTQPDLRSGGAGARAPGGAAGDRPGARYAGRHHLRSSAVAIYPDQPMGWPILGDEDTVALSRARISTTYMGANYRAGGMTLVASGAVDHATIVKHGRGKVRELSARRRPRR